MGLLDKVKGILFDEEEIEIPEITKETKKDNKNVIKKEVEEEKNPIRELKVPKEDFSDRKYRSESTFTFPIDFDDEEETIKEPAKIEEIKPVKKPIKYEREVEKRDYSSFLNKKDEKKHFKPTPIISPVYGVLDQNYKKEDVIVKKDVLRAPKGLTIEEVRKRAFGSLEDEIDANLTGTKEINVEKVVEEKKVKEEVVVEEPVDKLKTIGELIDEDNKNLEIPEIESIDDKDVEYNKNDTNIIDVPSNSIDDLLKRDNSDNIKDEDIDDEEADLFSLIDSMYEEKGE